MNVQRLSLWLAFLSFSDAYAPSRRSSSGISCRHLNGLTSSIRGGGLSNDLFGIVGPLFSTVSKVVQENLEPMLTHSNAKIQGVNSLTQKNVSQERQHNPSLNTLSLVLGPPRIVKLAVVALILSELLDRLGVLENPHLAKNNILQAWKKARMTSVPEWKGKAVNWWDTSRKPGGTFHGWSRPTEKLATWQPKHQLAIGVMVGLTFSPLFWNIASKLGVATVIVYALSEADHKWKNRSGKSPLDKFSGEKFSSVQIKLEVLRETVRSNVKDPKGVPSRMTESIDQLIPNGTLPPNTKWGIVAGLGAGLLV